MGRDISSGHKRRSVGSIEIAVSEAALGKAIEQTVSLLFEINDYLGEHYDQLGQELKKLGAYRTGKLQLGTSLQERLKQKEECNKKTGQVIFCLQFYDQAAQKISHQCAILAALYHELNCHQKGTNAYPKPMFLGIISAVAGLCLAQVERIHTECQEMIKEIKVTLEVTTHEANRLVPSLTKVALSEWLNQKVTDLRSLLHPLAGAEKVLNMKSSKSLTRLLPFYTTKSERKVHQAFLHSHQEYTGVVELSETSEEEQEKTIFF